MIATSNRQQATSNRKDVSCRLSLVAYFVACFLSLVAGAQATAAPNYDRTVTQLSEAITQYKLLSESHEKYDVAFRRDPMKPLVDAQGNLQATSGLKDGLWVQGIIWSEERPLVVIEDDLFEAGDVLDDYTIREIRQDGIAVERGTETKFIPIDRGIPAP